MNTAFAFLTGFGLVLFTAPKFIPYLTRLKFGQTIREEGPEHHQTKGGTPTMGGVLFILSSLVAAFAFTKVDLRLLIVTLSFFGFGLIGFIDDYIKVVLKRNLGLRAWQKIVLQLIVAGIVVGLSLSSEIGQALYVPFFDNPVDLGVVFIPFSIFVILAFVNAVNLADGLDGLATGLSAISYVFFFVAALVFGHQSLGVFSVAVIGALMGFLKYNYYPAKVFMGDTGSMALGGGIAALAVIEGLSLLMVVVGGVFVAEALSVVLQVFYFKKTKGRRLFKMTPIHHHFELSGWSEKKVVHRFWLVAAVLCMIGFVLL
ncbi:MAG TPA: phospho-N-acetylmuramoyl-pentapeptide-transferase [Eubacteriaceae bacterium]|nr:phospho-N-acetylmuramoyl-pentapeptide-transferase [Eubacteriaceae bacterium]